MGESRKGKGKGKGKRDKGNRKEDTAFSEKSREEKLDMSLEDLTETRKPGKGHGKGKGEGKTAKGKGKEKVVGGWKGDAWKGGGKNGKKGGWKGCGKAGKDWYDDYWEEEDWYDDYYPIHLARVRSPPLTNARILGSCAETLAPIS